MVNLPQLRDRLAKPWSLLTSPYVLLTAILGLAYYPFVLGHIIFNRDLARFIHPIRWFVRDSLERGDRPWWTPHIGLGHSMLADPQSAIFYPVNLLHHIGPLPGMVMLVLFLHLGWGAAGMARVATAFGIARSPSFVAGVAWALSGYVASLWTNGARLPSAAWIPWQILAFINLAQAVAQAVQERRCRLRAVAWLALANAGAVLAGDVFVAMMGHMVGLGLALAWLFGNWQKGTCPDAQAKLAFPYSRRVLLGFLAAVVPAVGTGVLLAMASLLPAAWALANTERVGGFTAHMAESGSLHPARLAEFASPEAFARAWYLAPNDAWVARYLDGAPLSLSTYLGGSVLALLVLAFLPLRKLPGSGAPTSLRDTSSHPSPATAALVAAVTLFFLLIAFGRHTPIHGVLRTIVLPLKYLRAPVKYLLAVVPCVALLAAWGAHRLLQAPSRLAWKCGLFVPMLLLALALFSPFLFPPSLAAQVQRGAWHGCLAAFLILAAWPLARWRPALAGAYLLLVVAADLALGSRFTLRFTEASLLREPPLARVIQPDPSRSLPFPRLFRGSKVQSTAAQASDLDGDRVTLLTLRDNLSVPLGVAILPGYGVAIPPTLTGLLEQGRLDTLRLLATPFALLSSPATSAPIPDGMSLMSTPIAGVRLYKVEHALPRVFVAFKSEEHSASEILRHLLDRAVVTGTTVLLEQREPWMETVPNDALPVPCQIGRFGNTVVQATCDAPFAGLAVFVEQYAPGWSAVVDGAPAPVLKANAVMRAVPLPAGKHTVVLNYEPPGLGLGAILSVLGAILTLVLYLGGRRLGTR